MARATISRYCLLLLVTVISLGECQRSAQRSSRRRAGLLDKFRRRSEAAKQDGQDSDKRIPFSLVDPALKGLSQDDGAPMLPPNSARLQGLLERIQELGARQAGAGASGRSTHALLSDALGPRGEVSDDGTELSRNYDILALTFEGDVVLSEAQAELIVRDLEGGRRRQKRKLVADERYRWGRRIPYELPSGTSASWQAAVAAGLKDWTDNTCVRFVPRSRRRRERDFVRFVQGRGCFSNVGRFGGAQVLSLGERCDVPGIVAHELGHVLGLWHEQSRPDRDQWISVQTANILPGTFANFERRRAGETEDFENPYDLGSAMHYGAKAFARVPGTDTMLAKDPNYQQTIGQRNGLTFIDHKIINEAYCADVCGGSGAGDCAHGGYPDPKDCGRCRCPSGLGGERCEEPQPSTGSCGGVLSPTGDWQSIASSANGVKCHWLIRPPPGQRVRLQVQSAEYKRLYPDACSSFVEVKYRKTFDQTGARLCSSESRSQDLWSGVISEGELALVIHDTSIKTAPGSFSLRYRLEGGDGGGVSGSGTTPGPRPRRRPRTRRPPPMPRPPPTPAPTPFPGGTGGLGGESGWSEWSECTVSCGGCGVRERTLRGSFRARPQRERCGQEICPRPDPAEPCTVELRVPCGFGGSGGPSPGFGGPSTGFGGPSTGFGGPSTGFGGPSTGIGGGGPSTGFGRGGWGSGLTPTGFGRGGWGSPSGGLGGGWPSTGGGGGGLGSQGPWGGTGGWGGGSGLRFRAGEAPFALWDLPAGLSAETPLELVEEESEDRPAQTHSFDRRKRQLPVCKRKFRYPCSGAAVSTCCQGFFPSNGACAALG